MVTLKKSFHHGLLCERAPASISSLPGPAWLQELISPTNWRSCRLAVRRIWPLICATTERLDKR